ncbi:MAG TPA: anhydro-N-acetylmuramic acid kinase [Puia sp.]|nr:anhydro-N-acetylmuramic acid kinase [Puia sp.]
MVYKVIGMMSGSSLDGLDLAFVHFQEIAGKWNFELVKTAHYPFETSWKSKLERAHKLNAYDYLHLHSAFGHFLGRRVNEFIESNDLQFQVQLIVSHGHTVFHSPGKFMTAQLGEGASIAAETGINTVTDLRAMDVALGGQGAPIVPIGELLLFGLHKFYLNLGGIANLSCSLGENFVAFDICPANRILNLLAANVGLEYDDGGKIASSGRINQGLLGQLNLLEYYGDRYPKSLDNRFGTDVVYPLIRESGLDTADAMRTYVEHIVIQIMKQVAFLTASLNSDGESLLVTGGGAHNTFLMRRLEEELMPFGICVVVPDRQVVDFKEALIMAFIGVLRWREEANTIASVTGAKKGSIGGALWIGQA